jgi:hypothetical protein
VFERGIMFAPFDPQLEIVLEKSGLAVVARWDFIRVTGMGDDARADRPLAELVGDMAGVLLE